jgi:hypothetical protein
MKANDYSRVLIRWAQFPSNGIARKGKVLGDKAFIRRGGGQRIGGC